MKPGVLLAEGARSAWAQKVSSAVTALVVAIMCFTALATAGRAAAANEELAASMDSAGSRLLTVTDNGPLGIVNYAALGVIQAIDGVETAVAIGAPLDVHSGEIAGGTLIPMWEVSDVSAVTVPDLGRAPGLGEATTTASGQEVLSLAEPAGFVEGRDQVQFPVVSRSTVHPGFADLGEGVLVQAGPTTQFRQLRVVARTAGEAEAVQKAVLASLGSFDPSKVTVDSPRALNAMADLVQAQLGRYNQQLLAMILGVGAIFIAIVVLSDVLLHRRELGRRRALGATRLDLSLLTVVRTVVPAVLGASLGCIVALAAFWTQGIALPIDFTVATGWLATVAAGLAAAIPAIWASTRDPVAVLRTP